MIALSVGTQLTHVDGYTATIVEIVAGREYVLHWDADGLREGMPGRVGLAWIVDWCRMGGAL